MFLCWYVFNPYVFVQGGGGGRRGGKRMIGRAKGKGERGGGRMEGGAKCVEEEQDTVRCQKYGFH